MGYLVGSVAYWRPEGVVAAARWGTWWARWCTAVRTVRSSGRIRREAARRSSGGPVSSGGRTGTSGRHYTNTFGHQLHTGRYARNHIGPPAAGTPARYTGR